MFKYRELMLMDLLHAAMNTNAPYTQEFYKQDGSLLDVLRVMLSADDHVLALAFQLQHWQRLQQQQLQQHFWHLEIVIL